MAQPEVQPAVSPQPAVNPQPGAAAGTAAGWHPDPMGRHELRYWDGAAWTDHVSDQGVQSADAVG